MKFDTCLFDKILEEKYNEQEKLRILTLNNTINNLKDFFKDKNNSVYITGSILKEGNFYDYSDIDIAIEGLDDNYFKIALELERLLDRDIDLIELEKCKFQNTIKQNGIKVI